jgi:hypothetical protein
LPVRRVLSASSPRFPDAQALRPIQDLRALQVAARQERRARELAEGQQLRAVEDFRAAHRQALDMADRLDKAYLETITALAKAVEARDDYTGGHIERVRPYSLVIGRGLGLAGSRLRELEFGAVLHDVGKIGIPDIILAKPGPLDAEEWVVKPGPLDAEEWVVPGSRKRRWGERAWSGCRWMVRRTTEKVPRPSTWAARKARGSSRWSGRRPCSAIWQPSARLRARRRKPSAT